MRVKIDSHLSCGIVQVRDLFTEKDPNSQTLIRAVKNYLWESVGMGEGTDFIPTWDSGKKIPITQAMRDKAVAGIPSRPHFVWSDYRGYGDILARNLEAGGWGKLISSGPNINQNTANVITTWLFIPNGAFHRAIGWNTRGEY